MDEVIEALGAERGYVALRDENGDLDFRTARGMDQSTIDNLEFQISRGVVAVVAQKVEICTDQRCSARSALQRPVECHGPGFTLDYLHSTVTYELTLR